MNGWMGVYIYMICIKSPLATFYGSSLSLSFHPHFITHIYKIGVFPSDEPNLRRVKGVQPESHCDVTGMMVNTGIAAYHPKFVSSPVFFNGFRHGKLVPSRASRGQEPLQFAGAARDASLRPFWRPGRGAMTWSQIHGMSWMTMADDHGCIETHGAWWLADPPGLKKPNYG